MALWFKGLGVGFKGCGFMVKGLWCTVLGFRVQDLVFGALGFRVLGCRVLRFQGLAFWVFRV